MTHVASMGPAKGGMEVSSCLRPGHPHLGSRTRVVGLLKELEEVGATTGEWGPDALGYSQSTEWLW